MNDPQRKPPSRPDMPTVRPKALQGGPDEPDDLTSAMAPKTEALDMSDIEALGSLLDEAERSVEDVAAFERQSDPAAGHDLETRRPPDAPPRELPAIGQFGPYAIVGRLALGGMAEILLAREESGGAGSRYLVVKRILHEYEQDASFVEMFLDEARVMMRLKHPNVCHVYKFGQQDGTHFIAMEWIHGASLGKLIRRSRKTGGVPPMIACAIVSAVAEALDHAHMAKTSDGREMGIVHRDVTPDNIMISYDGAVKLLDFGIAKAEARSHKTQAGVVKGKFAYMAPEQCRAKELDHRVDVFALGVCLYEALTGRPLYRRETEFETMEAIVRGPVPKLADRMKDAPPELEAIIQRCLAKNPDDRFSSAGELQEALGRYVAGKGEVITARRIKELMDKLFREEQRRGPTVDTTPFGSSFHMQSSPSSFGFGAGVTEDGGALPDLPMPPLELEPTSTPAYQGASFDPDDNARPGLGPPLSARAGASLTIDDPLSPAPHPLAKDRRPVPTAPARPVPTASPPSSGGGAKWAVIGGLALALLAGGGWFGWRAMQPSADEAIRTGPAPILTGAVEVRSEPAGATLFVDGEERGVTPLTVPDLLTGSHPIRLELEGHRPHEGRVEIRADETRSITQPLEPIEQPEGPVETGRLSLSSQPRATVFHDGEELGRTPLRNVVLPAGVVRLELETPDGQRHTRGVMVRANDATSTNLDLR